MAYTPSSPYLAEVRAAALSARSEEHIDDVDAQMPRQDVLIPPWSSLNRQNSSLQAGLSPAAFPRYTSVDTFAIQVNQNNFTNNTGQDVLPQLSDDFRSSLTSSSPSYQDEQPRRHALESTTLPGSSAQPLHHGSINSLSTRLRTSLPVFCTTSTLAAHYGIPTKLPPTPRTIGINNAKPPVPRFNEAIPTPVELSSSTSSSNPVDFFQSLMSGYINMLSNRPDDNASEHAAPQSPARVEPSAEEAAQNVASMLFGGSGDFTASPWDEFLTSPLLDDESPFESLLETPAQGAGLNDFFSSPVVADINSTDSSYNDFPLFSQAVSYHGNAIDVSKMTVSTVPPTSALLQTPNFDGCLTMSPATPALDPPSMQASPVPTDSFKPSRSVSRARSKAPTGTRKNITPESLVPLDAPTQPRSYVLPSSTSRKEIPAVFARKRARSTAFDEEDELAEEGEDGALVPTLSEAQAIAAKRRQNTLAARRSRKRKLEYQRQLEELAEAERREKEMWKERALMLRAQVVQMGFPEPFRDEA